ncbi:MAG: M48 family metallopeptidase [Terracidiphilus sp.]
MRAFTLAGRFWIPLVFLLCRQLPAVASAIVFAALALWACAPQSARAQTAAARPAQAAAGPALAAPALAAPAPQQQAYTLPPGKLAKAIALSRIRNILDIAGSLWAIVFLWLLLATRAAAGLEAWARHIVRRRWLQGLVFFAALLIAVSLANLPLDWLGEHFSRAYGISVQGWAGWSGDEAKSLALSLLFGVPLLLFFNWIVRVSRRRYWLWAWAVTMPIIVIATFAAPLLIDPLFNKFEPLEKTNPALVQQLEKVVARTGTHIPPDRMFLMKASAKTNGLNAYVTGIGPSKRIVVWDTTAGRIPDDEILFIFAHESGHYVLHHIPKGLALTAAGSFFVFWACAWFAAWALRRRGQQWRVDGLASRAGFVVLLFALSVAGFLSEPVSNAVSRHFEHQADIYGQEAIHGIVPDPQKTAVAAFNALGRAWLENPRPNPFIEFWLFTHPSTEQRANFAARYNPWANGGHGKYFKN